ncbi:unnamed protein product [Urochloa humidicola]
MKRHLKEMEKLSALHYIQVKFTHEMQGYACIGLNCWSPADCKGKCYIVPVWTMDDSSKMEKYEVYKITTCKLMHFSFQSVGSQMLMLLLV